MTLSFPTVYGQMILSLRADIWFFNDSSATLKITDKHGKLSHDAFVICFFLFFFMNNVFVFEWIDYNASFSFWFYW